MLWRDVFVPPHVVAGDGFTAAVGRTVEMPLMLDCQFRTGVPAPAGRPAQATAEPAGYPHPAHRRVHDIVGRAVALPGSRWADGWMLDVDGLGIFVSEADAGPAPGAPASAGYRETGSDPALPAPAGGSWIRARGRLSMAEGYEIETYRPAADLLRRAVRSWRVGRIVRLDAPPGRSGRGPGRDVPAVGRPGRGGDTGRATVGYLLDLEQLGHG